MVGDQVLGYWWTITYHCLYCGIDREGFCLIAGTHIKVDEEKEEKKEEESSF